MIDEMKNISKVHRTFRNGMDGWMKRSLNQFGQRRLNRFKCFADRLFFPVSHSLTDVYLLFSVELKNSTLFYLFLHLTIFFFARCSFVHSSPKSLVCKKSAVTFFCSAQKMLQFFFTDSILLLKHTIHSIFLFLLVSPNLSIRIWFWQPPKTIVKQLQVQRRRKKTNQKEICEHNCAHKSPSVKHYLTVTMDLLTI